MMQLKPTTGRRGRLYHNRKPDCLRAMIGAHCMPYDFGGEKPFYPDFIVVKKKGDEYEVDVIEPHDDSRTDTWAKAKGLAKFADDHHFSFGRLMIGRIKSGVLQVVDVADAKTRAVVRGIASGAELEALFKPIDG